MVKKKTESGVQRMSPETSKKVKELSAINPYMIGIGRGAIITWIVYRVSQSQEFRNKLSRGLR
jgi:hypothetical protein